MKRIAAVLFAALVMTAHAQRAVTLRVDAEHLQVQRADGSQPKAYSFGPTEVVVLDSAGYELRMHPKLEGKPLNSIQLLLSDSEKYSAAWNSGQTRQVLSAATLVPAPGSAPFKGFVRGKGGVVAIGRLEGGNFYVSWVGMFKVQ
jgi:hypothetical protein